MSAPNRAEKIGRLALVAVAALLPFELKQPIVTLGPLVITNVEVVLYLALFIWIMSRMAIRRIRWTALHGAVIAWATVMILSAIFAPANQAEAVKFALRSLSGCALFFAAADLASTPEHAAQVMFALAVGAMVSALAALAEIGLPGASAALMAFKTQPSATGSFARASGTFQYANIGAMYWEAALPIVLAAGAYISSRRNETRWQWIAATMAGVPIEAIILSASRAALSVAGLALLAMLAISQRAARTMRTPATFSLTAVVILTAVNVLASPLLTLRLQSESDSSWYRAEYRMNTSVPDIEAGRTVTFSITVRNLGVMSWPAVGDQPVRLSYHWRDLSTGQTTVYEGARTALAADVPPGAESTLEAHVRAPDTPGHYTLQWDLVHETVTWFSSRGTPTGDTSIRVTAATTRRNPTPPPVTQVVPQSQPARFDLWRAGLAMWLEHPLLGIGPDNFRYLYGAYLSLQNYDDRIHANSLYVETLADLGITGVLALIALIATLARTTRHAWRATSDPPTRLLLLGLLAAVATFFAHGVVDYFFEFTPTMILFWLCAGMSAGLRQGEARA